MNDLSAIQEALAGQTDPVRFDQLPKKEADRNNPKTLGIGHSLSNLDIRSIPVNHNGVWSGVEDGTNSAHVLQAALNDDIWIQRGHVVATLENPEEFYDLPNKMEEHAVWFSKLQVPTAPVLGLALVIAPDGRKALFIETQKFSAFVQGIPTVYENAEPILPAIQHPGVFLAYMQSLHARLYGKNPLPNSVHGLLKLPEFKEMFGVHRMLAEDFSHFVSSGLGTILLGSLNHEAQNEIANGIKAANKLAKDAQETRERTAEATEKAVDNTAHIATDQREALKIQSGQIDPANEETKYRGAEVHTYYDSPSVEEDAQDDNSVPELPINPEAGNT